MAFMTHITSTWHVVLPALLFLIIVIVVRHRRPRTTKLKGPSSKSFLLGYSNELLRSSLYSDLIEEWEIKYGSVYQVPTTFGKKDIVLCDLKAVMHLYSNDTYTYRQLHSIHYFLETFFGRNLLWAEADAHKRQRKALSPAFSNSAIRNLTPIFYDSAYTLKTALDSTLQSSSRHSFVIDVQAWLGHVSLDTIGLAGFSHDFESLKGKSPPVVAALDSFGSVKRSIPSVLIILFARIFPLILRIPTERLRTMQCIVASISNVTKGLIESMRGEKGADVSTDRSIIGTLVRSESVNTASLCMTKDEIMAQTFLLIIAGYETTAISMTWALVELCRHPEIQEKLRGELAQFSAEDPTWEQLTNGLPFLDAVVCETLRLHAPGAISIREAHEDDIIPLDNPIHTAEGEVVDSIFVRKGTTLYVPIKAINRSVALWGENAKEFNPSRWLDNSISQEKASEIQGYRHMLSFGAGTRGCIGRVFALTEIKAVLSVLMRNYTFELPDGPETKFEYHRSFIDHPKVVGQDGPRVPMIVRRIES